MSESIGSLGFQDESGGEDHGLEFGAEPQSGKGRAHGSDRSRTQPAAGWLIWLRWVVATVVGWTAGVFGAIILSYLIVNPFYPRETNLIVGLCVGASAAAFQAYVLRPWFRLASAWIWGGAIIMAPPFILSVVFDELGMDMAALSNQLVLGAISVVVALAGAFLQARALRPHTARARWWPYATMCAWGAAFAAGAVVGIIASGVALAVLSGLLIAWILQGAAPRGPE